MNNIHEISMIKTKLQHGGALCGFFSLYNILNFLEYLKNREDKFSQLYFLKKTNSTSQFWLFYKKTVKFLLDSEVVDKSDRESLLKMGQLERYQFKLLLETNKEIKTTISSSEKLEIKFLNYFYGFNSIQGMSDEEIKDLQIALNYFKKWNKEKILIYVILLGVTNHWSVLILENFKGEIKHYYLDSSNENVFKLVNDFYEQNKFSYKSFENFLKHPELSVHVERYAERQCNEMEKFITNPISPWFRKCYQQWILDINSVFVDISKILHENLSLYEIVINSMIERVTDTFEEYNSCKLDSESFTELNKVMESSYSEEETILIKEKLLQWLTIEYHPQVLKTDVLDSFEAYSDFFSIRNLQGFIKLENWIKFSNNIRKHIHVEDIENGDLISRYYDVIGKLEIFLLNR